MILLTAMPVCKRGHIIFEGVIELKFDIMKKVLMITCLALTMACSERADREQDGEVAVEEEVDAGAGEEISPQLELDSTDRTFEVDTVSSPQEVDEETEKELF